MDLVSVVITTYKREPQMVERAISSIVRQTYKNIELLVVDDSPNDFQSRNEIEQLVNAYKSAIDISYYPHIRNLGACAARNTGIRNARGKYICFLDDDDEYDAQKIEKQLKFIVHNKSVAMVYCDCIVINDETGETTRNHKKLYRGMVFDHLLEKNFIGTTSFPLIKRECLEELGGFDTEQPACQDYDMWLRICKYYSVDYINEPLVLYHNHTGDQITKNTDKRIIALQRLMIKNEEYLKNKRRLWSIFHLKLVNEYIDGNRTTEALRLLKQCIIRYPWLIKGYLTLLARTMKKCLLRR